MCHLVREFDALLILQARWQKVVFREGERGFWLLKFINAIEAGGYLKKVFFDKLIVFDKRAYYLH